MRRRALLASGLSTVLLGGCLSSVPDVPVLGDSEPARPPTAYLSMEHVDDARIAEKVLGRVTPAYEGGKRTTEAAIIEEAVRDGAATVERARIPLRTEHPVVYEGTVYWLDHEIVEADPATWFHVVVDIVTGGEPSGRTVAFADLPAVDRQAFETRGLDEGENIGVGTSLLYTDEQVDRSVLVPETDIVIIEWENGNRASWAVDGSHETTRKTYRYTVEETMPASEHGAEVREQYAWELSGLSDAERDIVEAAVTDERETGETPDGTPDRPYAVGPEETPSASLVSLVDRFRPHEQAPGSGTRAAEGVSGHYLVRYDGTVYWTYLAVREAVFESLTP